MYNPSPPPPKENEVVLAVGDSQTHQEVPRTRATLLVRRQEHLVAASARGKREKKMGLPYSNSQGPCIDSRGPHWVWRRQNRTLGLGLPNAGAT